MLSGLSFNGTVHNRLFEVKERNGSEVTVKPGPKHSCHPFQTSTSEDRAFLADTLTKIESGSEQPVISNGNGTAAQDQNWLTVKLPSAIVRFCAPKANDNVIPNLKSSVSVTTYQDIDSTGHTPDGNICYKSTPGYRLVSAKDLVNEQKVQLDEGSFPAEKISQLASYILENAAQMPQTAKNILEAFIK